MDLVGAYVPGWVLLLTAAGGHARLSLYPGNGLAGTVAGQPAAGGEDLLFEEGANVLRPYLRRRGEVGVVARRFAQHVGGLDGLYPVSEEAVRTAEVPKRDRDLVLGS